MFQLDGLKALVTGASGNIGAAIATALSQQGAEIILSGTRRDKLVELQKKLKNKSHIIVADLSTRDGVQELIKQADTIGVDILVNNAGLNRDNLSILMKDEEWDQVIQVNLTAGFFLMRGLIRSMMKRRFGRIINITSVVGHAGNAGQANYVATKAAMTGITKTVAEEFASRGVTTNAVAPGLIKTEMTDKLTDEQRNVLLERVPSGKIGMPEDVAAAVAFLASRESGYITGATLHVNGGSEMRD
ncbi:MAG: 3-oxoacyl-ACP reductase FabG [Alphaproteobacteria bacterium]|nr:3-oxoacyl-ACP reductase FabG [Alphaproteobacteria bacterium]